MSRWSSEHVVADFKDMQASCMAVDCHGKYALLAGRRYIYGIDLDKPNEYSKDQDKRHPRQSKWEVGAVQWNPHQSNGHLYVAATNQRADILSWKGTGKHIPKSSLKAHTRVISDLDWSPWDNSCLATCSVDTYTYLWDISDPRKPSRSLQAVAGASQVQWNKKQENILATTHDGDIRLWDIRDQKGTSPSQYIAGHLSKIHGLDWNPSNEFQLATSSQDCTVKFWDIRNPKKAEDVLPTGSPVWRARFTPFGSGMVTVVVPQLRRGENSLLLWNTMDLSQPVHTFVGHTDVVLEFHWRKQEEGSPDFHLVTWSKDQSLRIWRIETHLQKLCGHEFQETKNDLDQFTEEATDAVVIEENHFAFDRESSVDGENVDNKTIPLITATPPSASDQKILEAEKQLSPQQPRTLLQEFNLVNVNIRNVTVDEMNPETRTCTVNAISGKHTVKLIMTFPSTYPNNKPPSFQFGKPTTIDRTAQNTLIKFLNQTSVSYVKHNRSCLEPCLRALVDTIDKLTGEEPAEPDTSFNLQPTHQPQNFLPIYSYGSFQDDSIPFPRTSGARFCGAGSLVCFNRPDHLKRTFSPGETTPRALSALQAYAAMSSVRAPQASQALIFGLARSPPQESMVPSVSTFYNYKERKGRARSKSRLKEPDFHRNRDLKNKSPSSPQKKANKAKCSPVLIHDITCLLPIHRALAEEYVLNTNDICAMCSKNAAAAAAVGRKDLVQVWQLVALATHHSLATRSDPDNGPPWAEHPFGKKLFQSLLDHYSALYDIQTLAMLCCAFGSLQDATETLKLAETASSNLQKSSSDLTPINSNQTHNPYHTIHPGDRDLASLITSVKIRRSNSWSESFEDYRFEEYKNPSDLELDDHQCRSKILDPLRVIQYDVFKERYANLLYQWDLKEKRAEVLKHVYVPPAPHKGIGFVSVCHHCHQETRCAQCLSCKNWSLQCVICHIAVKGCSNFCLQCGHGGHSFHMLEWFKKHDVCPTGCGCRCLEENPMA